MYTTRKNIRTASGTATIANFTRHTAEIADGTTPRAVIFTKSNPVRGFAEEM